MKWDYFENVIPLLQKKYHLLVPALPGYDFEDDSDFTSVEQIAAGKHCGVPLIHVIITKYRSLFRM